MTKTFIKFLLPFLVVLLPDWVIANDTEKKARVIVMTDGEIDDQSSMIRFLLYTCDVDLQAIIETNSVWQRSGHSKENWYENQLNAYEWVYPNLIKHNPNYPKADEIRRKSYVGDEDPAHLNNVEPYQQWPGHRVEHMPDSWPNTPGSDKIVEILLNPDPSPVYIQAWGGGNTAAKAFYKLKKDYPADYDRAISKVIMYNVSYQDDAGNYIETYHPKATMIFSKSFHDTWDYNSLPHTTDFITHHVKNNHGPLGALYPQTYVSEGDTPSFLYSLNNGLRNFEHPTFGGWGGRFEKLPDYANGYIDTYDDGDIKKSLRRWVDQANSDFQARMDWCVAQTYSAANHKPDININVSENITAKPGQTITLSAEGTTDPDGNGMQFKWWQYKDAGTYQNLVNINNATNKTANLVIPAVDNPKTLHIILEVTDNGSPALVSYKRIIITINPNENVETNEPVTNSPSCTATGTILREQWNSLDGAEISAIPLNTPPTSTSQLTLFEGPLDIGSIYGSRIRGYICPPQTGSYTFFISGDDDCELWLSTDDNPANKSKIAGFNGWTYPRQWDKFPSQTSATITLEAGRRYYIEALHKEAVGSDHVAVGWQLPDGSLERPIAGSRLSPYVPVSGTILSGKNTESDLLEKVASPLDGDKSLVAYPNPFGKTVNLNFTLPADEAVLVQVYSLQGTLLETVFRGTAKAGQRNGVTWDGSNYANGVYLGKLTYGNKVIYKRLLLQR
jgi:hypothetical protein